MNFLDDWLARKRARWFVSIRERRTSEFRCRKHLGPRSQFAGVRLEGRPADSFTFQSEATWPNSNCDYTLAVLDGILDELFATGIGHIVAKIDFLLESIEFHEVDTCAAAFYLAARGAVREIHGLDRFPTNVDWPTYLPNTGSTREFEVQADWKSHASHHRRQSLRSRQPH